MSNDLLSKATPRPFDRQLMLCAKHGQRVTPWKDGALEPRCAYCTNDKARELALIILDKGARFPHVKGDWQVIVNQAREVLGIMGGDK